MNFSEMIEADKIINGFMQNAIGKPQVYYDSWNNLMKVTKEIFKLYEKNDKAKMCELLRYALYWNNFEHVYSVTILMIKHFTDYRKLN